MATSSNQPDENMTIGTSKPDAQNLDGSKFDEYVEEEARTQNQNVKFVAGCSDSDSEQRRPRPRTARRRMKQINPPSTADGYGRGATTEIGDQTTRSIQRENISTGGQKYGLSLFDDFQMVDDESVVDQAYKISRMVADHAKCCPRLHMVLNDRVEQVNVIIEKLPESWKDYAATLKDMQMQKELSFGALVNHLRVEEKKRAQNQKVEEKKEYSRYLPLYKAALRGDWAAAESFFDQDPGALTAPINDFSQTASLVAAAEGRNAKYFLEKLVDKMPPGSVDEAYGKVLNWAAYVGNTEAVKVILSKNPSLVYYREDDNIKRTPFNGAATNGKRDILLYLLDMVKNDEDSSKLFPDEDSAAFLMDETIWSGYYDIALYLVKKYPLSAFSVRNNGSFGLKSLAVKAGSAFKSGTHYRWWQRLIYAHVPVKLVDCIISPTLPVLVENPVGDPDQVMGRSSYNWARLLVEYFCISVPCIKHIQKQKEMHLQTLELVKYFCGGIASLQDSTKHWSLTRPSILWAARNGIPEIVHEIVESFPSVLWTKDTEGRGVFENAVLQRQENAFNLVYQMGKYSREFVLQYTGGNHILHLAGQLAPPTKLSQISGAALQMQLELQWFEAVKKLMSPRDIGSRNFNGKTPAMIFTDEHKKLVAQGEKWMKHTANSCTIPAALIVTVVFAAAITVPGGINNTNTKGEPIFNKEVVFNIFVVSDAISLFTSITSLLVHLSILTSRFAEGDFLFALPNRLIIGLFTLFVSITAMLIAFSCALYLLFGKRAWILYPVAGFACVPIISFASLQYPLLRDLMKSTYGPGIFGKQSEVPFYS